MSAYDAYQLSIRDDTSFIVPSGNSGSNSSSDSGNITLYKLRIKVTHESESGSGSVLYQPPSISTPFVLDENLATTLFGETPFMEDIISFLPKIEYDSVLIEDGEWYEYRIIGINGASYVIIGDNRETDSGTLVTNMSENVEKIILDGNYYFHKITGDAFIELTT